MALLCFLNSHVPVFIFALKVSNRKRETALWLIIQSVLGRVVIRLQSVKTKGALKRANSAGLLLFIFLYSFLYRNCECSRQCGKLYKTTKAYSCKYNGG